MPPIPNTCGNVIPRAMSRRDLLKTVAGGFGWLAFAGLNAQASPALASASLAPREPHFLPRARRVIFLCMQGGPSHLDTFDYKPQLSRDTGKPGVAKGGGSALFASPFEFRQHGESGLWISELYPEVARQADKLCVINSMKTDIPSHPQAFTQLHTGSARFVRPSLGSWVLYGLGTPNQNLPGFISISPPLQFGAGNFGSAFLPAMFQGTRLGAQRENLSVASMGNLENVDRTPAEQRRHLDLVQAMNRQFLEADPANSEVEGVIHSYELAFRMQSEVPHLLDISGETEATRKLYGIGDSVTDDFGRQCLLARRFAEAGVRFIEVCHAGWDQHQNLTAAIRKNTSSTDRPIAALLRDLEARGLLDDTLVLWGGEFGRTPDSRKPDGRDHNAKGFSMWLAGGGTRGGMNYGATDQYGWEAVDRPMHVHDLHATLLHALGLDHERLTYHYGGRDYRLTDVYGDVATGVLG
ncbi:MAG TPA: DUF1501 domain-containing protein [Candidatus Limnocylindria bacterium]|nr:DUF1501 domain-containing protein [Candidatus Limnocylindria bacterium]